MASCKKSTSVQTLIYPCGRSSIGECRKKARKWAKDNGFLTKKVECKLTRKGVRTCRVRQVTPGQFCSGTFRTITLSKSKGVKAVIGKRKVRRKR